MELTSRFTYDVTLLEISTFFFKKSFPFLMQAASLLLTVDIFKGVLNK